MKRETRFHISAFIAWCWFFFIVYHFRNFEESEDELRNEVVESLEKLTTSKEEGREEVSSSLKDVEKPGERERISRLKSEELNEGLEAVSSPSNDQICITDEDKEIAKVSQNIQVWLLYFFLFFVLWGLMSFSLNNKIASICYSIRVQIKNIHLFVRVFQLSQGLIFISI